MAWSRLAFYREDSFLRGVILGDRLKDGMTASLSGEAPASSERHGRLVPSADGTPVWYSDSGGPGEALVFLHGFSGSSSASGHFAARASAAGFRFVAPDLRGHGMSGKPAGSGSYDMPRFIDDFEAIVDDAQLSRVHIVGHCMGGMVAIAAAARMPERVASLTLVATSLRPAADQQLAAWAEKRSPDWMRSLARRAFPRDNGAEPHVDYGAFDDTGDFYWRRMVADYRALSADTAFAIVSHLKDLDLTETAARVAAPAFVVHGARDSVFPPACAERAVAVLPRSTLLVEPEHNHVSLVLRPDSPLFDAVLCFIAAV